jgi:hypothetical protein
MFINGISRRWRHMPKEAAAVAAETDTIRERAAKMSSLPNA